MREQENLLSEELKSVSEIPKIFNDSNIRYEYDISMLLDKLESFTHKEVWESDCIAYQVLLSIRDFHRIALLKLEEIDVFFGKLLELQSRSEGFSADLTNQLNVLRNKIAGFRSMDFLFPLSDVNLRDLNLGDTYYWAPALSSLPKSMKKIDLTASNVEFRGIQALSTFEFLEEIDLSGVLLECSNYWVSVIECLPIRVKKLGLASTNIDTAGLQKLSRFEHLEEIGLQSVNLLDEDDWVPALSSMPISVKKIDLGSTNIDTAGLQELSRLEHLEEIGLQSVKLLDEDGWMPEHSEHWAPVLECLPISVRSIDLTGTNCPGELKEALKSKGMLVICY